MEVVTKNTGGSRGKAKTIYVKPETEEKAKRFCEQNNITFSLLMAKAIDFFIEEFAEEDDEMYCDCEQYRTRPKFKKRKDNE